MSPWSTLGIEPCDDARAVKRAYAKKLKLTRPDEKPQEFQQLHAAYKQALKLVENRQMAGERAQPNESRQLMESPQRMDSPQRLENSQHRETPQPKESPEPVHGAHQEPESTAIPVDVPLGDAAAGHVHGADAEQGRAAAEAGRQKRIDEYHRALQRVERALQNDRQISVEETWHFLAETPYILEDEYNWNLGLGVFERFARFNQQAAEKGRKHKYRPQITANILTYCDQLFDWSGNREHIYRALDDSLADTIFDALQLDAPDTDPLQGVRGGRELVKQKARVPEENLDEYYFGHLLARAFAVLLDLFLIYVSIGLATSVIMIKVMDKGEADANVAALSISIVGYLLMAWIVESSPLQATPGKYLLGYRVTNRQFRRIGYLHGFGRIISFVLTLPLFKVGWLINCFLGGNLLHDRLSRSYVINFRKSREEYLRKLNS